MRGRAAVLQCASGTSDVPEAPLNYLQHYVLSRQMRNPTTNMFNLAQLFRLTPTVDPARFARALEAAGRAHGSLRTVIHRSPYGVITQRQSLAAEEVTCPVVRLSEQELRQRRDSLVRTFDLFDSRLFGACVFDCGSSSYLLSNFHHLICDGYSFPLILQDAHTVYEGGQVEPDDYFGVLAKRAARANSPMGTVQRNLLQEVLRDERLVTIPEPDFSRSHGYRSLETPISLPADLETFLTERRLTRHHAFLAATVVALGWMTESDAVLVDWVFHGRVTHDELKTVGAFMVDLPLVAEDLSKLTGSDALTLAKHETFRGIRSANIFRNVSELNPDGRDRLTFNYQNEWSELMSAGRIDPEGDFGWALAETIPLKAPHRESENPFNVNILDRRGEVRLLLEYDSGRYDEATVARYRDFYLESLHWLLDR